MGTRAGIFYPAAVTTSSSPEYARRLVEHVARSFLTSPIMIGIIAEVDDLKRPPFTPLTYERRLKHFESGSIFPSAAKGAFIAEADDWTAASLWEPPGFSGSGLAAPRYQNPLPVLKEFLAKAAAARAKHLGSKHQERYWHLTYLARDPSKTGRGAVSAVVRPFLERARQDQVPAWLEAVDLYAVHVYEHYGFRVCEKMTLAKGIAGPSGWPEDDGDGFAVWAMVFDEHLRS